jgi:hypothetical protein
VISRNVPPLHPDSSKWYWVRWSQTELGDGVTIASTEWTLPDGLQSDQTGLSGLSVGIRLSVSTGTAGNYYDVGVAVTTSKPEVLNETLRILVSTDGH